MKMARPVGPKKILITIRLSPESHAVLKELAVKNRRSMSAEGLKRIEDSIREELLADGRRLRYRRRKLDESETESSD